MPMHSVETNLVYHNGMRMTEFGKRDGILGCFAKFVKGGNEVTAMFCDGIAYRYLLNGKEVRL